MFEELSDRGGLLAGLRELRPVGGDVFVEVEEPAAVGDRHRGGRHALGGGPDSDQGVVLPQLRALLVAKPAPDIDDELAVSDDCAGCAKFLTLGEVRRNSSATAP